MVHENEFSGSSAQQEAGAFLMELTGTVAELTSSCTHALEIAMMAIGLEAGDEVIVPSFAFMSVPNAVLRAGGKPVFADIDAMTMNMSAQGLEQRLTSRTRAVVYMHYGGLSHDMSDIQGLCQEKALFLIEDAAHAISSYRKGKHLGTMGTFGAVSFHHTKNIHCGEGGALLFPEAYRSKVELIMEKGTDKRAFMRGEVPAYNWQTVGSSFSMSAVSAAFLNGQLKALNEVTDQRKKLWKGYYERLTSLQDHIDLPALEGIEEGNGHIFYIKTAEMAERKALITFMMEAGIEAHFHYPALHDSPAGKRIVGAHYPCPVATTESARLLRLPIYPTLTDRHLDYITDIIRQFYVSQK